MRRLLYPLHSRLPRQRQQGCKRLRAYWTCALTGVCGSCSVNRCKIRHGSSKLQKQLIIIRKSIFLLHRASSKISRRIACRMHALLEPRQNPSHAPHVPFTGVDKVLQDPECSTDSSPASIVAISCSVGSSDSNTTGCATPRGTQHTAEIMAAANALSR